MTLKKCPRQSYRTTKLEDFYYVKVKVLVTQHLPGSGRSPGEGNSNPLQYSCLENPTDRGAWWATVHSVAESDMTEVTACMRPSWLLPTWYSVLLELLETME